MTPRQIDTFFARLAARNPHPVSELDYTNPFTLLVAVVLSAQATDAGVNRATRDLFARVTGPEDLLALGEEGLKAHIRTIGLYQTKARHLMKLAEILVQEHSGAVPENREALMRLPGVGQKTASVVLNVAFGHPLIPVDTHVFRVAHRTGLSQGATPAAVQEQLEQSVPEPWKGHAHHWLILHGRYVCKARRPDCPGCPVADLCTWRP